MRVNLVKVVLMVCSCVCMYTCIYCWLGNFWCEKFSASSHSDENKTTRKFYRRNIYSVENFPIYSIIYTYSSLTVIHFMWYFSCTFADPSLDSEVSCFQLLQIPFSLSCTSPSIYMYSRYLYSWGYETQLSFGDVPSMHTLSCWKRDWV